MTGTRKIKKTVHTATTRAKNATEVAKGKVKATTGKAVGNRHLQAKGNLEAAKGRVKQTGQRLKESLDS